MTPSDPVLVTRALEGDRDAFGELVLRHQSAVRRFLRHLARGDEALADDLAQDTFVQAWHRLGQFRGDAAFATWLLGIAHNHWRNARRKQREVALEAAHLDALETVPPAAPTSDLRQDLAQAMQRLDPVAIAAAPSGTLLPARTSTPSALRNHSASRPRSRASGSLKRIRRGSATGVGARFS